MKTFSLPPLYVDLTKASAVMSTVAQKRRVHRKGAKPFLQTFHVKEQVYIPDSSKRQTYKTILTNIQDALADKNFMVVTYQRKKDDKIITRRVAPYKIKKRAGGRLDGLYAAIDTKEGQVIRFFYVERIKNIEVLEDEHYVPQKGWAIQG